MGFEITKAGQATRPRLVKRINGNLYYVDINQPTVRKDGDEKKKEEEKKVYKNLSERMA
jgi:hypothetical protein